ncbi:two-component system sensor histidine kinase NtrB [Fuerstiella marisgermanici]|uniref:histidine kinase n=1 Tax=Fuerstiella marisgermanici TaxID=1891926 RepID=A0A1P8WI31_9PLAN|nr:ATP-binding protein [Fuerstiella marisgermanici]APZ93718.1 Sensor protein FixL [Fuerstiella marisgermanici]
MSGEILDRRSLALSGLRMRREPSPRSTSRNSILLQLLTTPWRILGLVLVVVFAVEAVVMLLLPRLLPADLPGIWEALIDSALLTATCAPLLWWVIISPLRRVALEAQALSSTIVENAGDGIVTVDPFGKVLSYNSAAHQLFGRAAEEILAQPIEQLLPDIRLTTTTVGEAVSTTGRRQTGDDFPASVSVRKIGEGDQSALVIIVRDLTEAHRAEIARTTAAREQEALRAQQMATLAQLATGVAHEIRNPLTAIKMLIQSTQTDGDSTTLPTEDVQIVEDQIRRMEQSVNALLDFARPSPVERKSLVLRELIPNVIRLLEGQAKKQGVELQFEEVVGDLVLNADRDQLQQLILNLGLNALNVMPNGGTLAFSLRNHGDGMACVLVSDTGPGIAADIFDDIFQPFFTTRKQGVGLGLNICRRIAEEHGGSLTAANGPSGGAVFELCLPSAGHSTEGNH